MRGEELYHLQEQLLERLDLTKDMTDEEIYQHIDELIIFFSKRKYISIPRRGRLRMELFHAIRKLDVLQELIEDCSVTEIMINGQENIFVERGGKVTRHDHVFSSKAKLEDVVQKIVAKCNRSVNEYNPIVDARLENGDRVNIILPPVALNGPIVTIRRFPSFPITMKELLQWNSINQEAAYFLKKLVQARYNIFISGGTGSGKTTFLNALSSYIPKEERIITIEDNAELQIQNLENLVRLEVRNANVEGENEVSIRALIKSALRMRPDRIIIGEVRSEETIDLLQAYNTGHDGSLSTGHGNSCVDMLSRLETMVLMGLNLPLEAVRRQIASGIDVLIHLGRMRDRTRRVLEISEIVGMEKGEIVMNCLYLFKEDNRSSKDCVSGELEFINGLCHREKLYLAGINENEEKESL